MNANRISYGPDRQCGALGDDFAFQYVMDSMHIKINQSIKQKERTDFGLDYFNVEQIHIVTMDSFLGPSSVHCIIQKKVINM